MTNHKIDCPKCDGQMTRGYVPDFSYASVHLGTWQRGSPRKSFFGGIKKPFKKGIPITAFRCSKCCLIEFYASDGFGAE
ncbi:MAG: PF20097 family protein [Akkermansiaceae bacterium]